MVEDLFKKYLNILDYSEHKLYKHAKDDTLREAVQKKIGDDRYYTYQGYMQGYIIGYIETVLKIAVKHIKLQLKADTLDLAHIEEAYYITREDVLYILKEILNGKI